MTKTVNDQDSGRDANGFNRVSFESNKIIFEEGDVGDSAYLILKGQVEIRRGTRTSNPRVLATLGKGDVFGEMALFDDRPRMGQAIALQDTLAIRISHKEFHDRLDGVDPVMQSIIVYMVKRVRNMADEFLHMKSAPNWSQWKKKE